MSVETVLVTKEGAFKARTVQRTPFEHRWDSQSLHQVGGVPWKNSLGVGDEEG